jgi:hypothetical protein
MALCVGNELVQSQAKNGSWSWFPKFGKEMTNDLTAELVVWLDEILQVAAPGVSSVCLEPTPLLVDPKPHRPQSGKKRAPLITGMTAPATARKSGPVLRAGPVATMGHQ